MIRENQADEFGTYFVRATLNGCVSNVAEVEVQVKPRPALPMAFNGGAVCADNPWSTLTLSVSEASATDGATYTWYDEFFQQLAPPTEDLEISITNLTAYSEDRAYAFYVQADLDGCVSEFSVPTMPVLNGIPPNTPFAGNDTIVCDNQVAILRAESPDIGSGRWTPVGFSNPDITIANPNQAVTTVNGLEIEDSPYLFQWTLSNGACENYATDTVEIQIAATELADAGEDIVACFSDVINLSAFPPLDPESFGTWTQPPAQQDFGVFIEDDNDPNTLISGLEPNNLYVFTWTISSTCGQDSSKVFVRVSPRSVVTNDAIVACNDDGIAQVEANEPGVGSTGVWTSPDPDIVFTDPTSFRTMVSNPESRGKHLHLDY